MLNPQMLFVARESKGWTQAELSRKTNLSQGAISRFESGNLCPTAENIVVISQALGFPASFFEQTERLYGFGSACVFHRKRQSVGVKVVRRLQALTNLVRLQVQQLLTAEQDAPELAFPTYELDEHDRSPERIAEFVRQAWHLPIGPIQSMVELIESAGGIVLMLPFGSRQLDAVSQWAPGGPPIFIVNAEMPNDRRRMSLAHELAHIVMHKFPTEDQEREADRFAGALLMPEDDIRHDLVDITLERLAHLKAFWRVSMAALLVRAKSLEQIDEYSSRRLWMAMSSLGYRTEEPVALPEERPTRVARLLQRHFEDLGYTRETLAAVLHTSDIALLESLVAPTGQLRLLS